MTYKESIGSSLKVWIWLYQNQGKTKEDSPYWEEIRHLRGNCPLCHFLNKCDECILYKKRACRDRYSVYIANFFSDYKHDVYTAYYYYNRFANCNRYPKRQKSVRAFIASKLRREWRQLQNES